MEKRETSQNSCGNSSCCLCKYGLDPKIRKAFARNGWQRRIVPVFLHLEKSNGKSYQHVRNDVFDFIISHWELLHPNGYRDVPEDKNWKECVKALLRRRKDLFESARGIFGVKGFWRLLPSVNRRAYVSKDSPLFAPSQEVKKSSEEIIDAEVIVWNDQQVTK